MVLYVNVFGATMIDGIVRIIDHALIVDIKNGESEVGDAEFCSESP
jgi:hypothetical protein